MDKTNNLLVKVFGVAIRPQTYLNMLYLLLAFPLGLFYFIYLVVGLSLGIPLIIIWIGLLILPAVLAGWWIFAAFERQLAIWLLLVNIPPMSRPIPGEVSTWERIKAYLTNPVTWKGLLFLFAKFPLGILSFVVLVTSIALTGAFLTAPLTFYFFPIDVWLWGNLHWRLDTLPEALLGCLIGLILLFISMHILNGLAWVSGQFARLMLGYYPATEPQVAPSMAEPVSADITEAPPVQETEVLPVEVSLPAPQPDETEPPADEDSPSKEVQP
jgi:hypothetical protein